MQSVTVDFDVAAPMRDGTLLRANVYRPAGEGPWPVLLTRLPYGKDYALGSAILDPVQAARRGYAVIVQDTRGRFRSEGDFYPFRAEAEDGFDSVAWAAGLPFSDGRVGMYGASYFGQTQWLAAVERPPALKAIAPCVTWDDCFHGHGFRHGAIELGMIVNWGLGMAFDSAVRASGGDRLAISRAWQGLAAELDALAERGFAELPLRGFGPFRRTGVASNWEDLLAHPMEAGYSRQISLSGRHDRVQVPVLNMGGWYDCFLGDTLANYRAMRELGVPTRLLVGPWTHGTRTAPVGELNFGYRSNAALIDLRQDFYSFQLRWFDHWLKGIDSGLAEEPPVKLFVMGLNRWREEPDWPLARAVAEPWYLRRGGLLSRAAPGAEEGRSTFVYDPAEPVPTVGGNTLLSPEYPAGPYDQRALEARPDVLTFTSDPLAADLEVTGPITVRLQAASDGPDTDWVARLCDVHPDGRSINLADGIVRARYRDFFRGAPASPIEPGRVYEYEIDLWATSNVFKAGHRVRVDITSSSFPRWDRNPNTGTPLGQDAELRPARQTIVHDASRPSAIYLPVVAG